MARIRPRGLLSARKGRSLSLPASGPPNGNLCEGQRAIEIIGAGGRTRTGTEFLPTDFKSLVFEIPCIIVKPHELCYASKIRVICFAGWFTAFHQVSHSWNPGG